MTIVSNGKTLDKILLSTQFESLRQEFTFAKKRYLIELRFKQYDLPYTFALKDFRYDRLPGVNDAMNFQSDIQIFNKEKGNREVVISMNDPLRYEGLSFFQSGWMPGEKGTVLQIVGNPGSWLPYIACLMASVGLSWHFVLMLKGYLTRTEKRKQKEGVTAVILTSRGVMISLLIPFIFVGWLLGGMMRGDKGASGDFDVERFGRLPIQHGGRFKPISTLGRDTLLTMQHRQRLSVYRFEEDDVLDWDALAAGFVKNEAGSVYHHLLNYTSERLPSLLANIQAIAKSKNAGQLAGAAMEVYGTEAQILKSFLDITDGLAEKKTIELEERVNIVKGINLLLHDVDFYNSDVWESVVLSDRLKTYAKKVKTLGLSGRVETHMGLLYESQPTVFGKPKLRKISPSQWILEVNAKPGYSLFDPVIRIDSPLLIEAMGWKHDNQKYFSYAQIVTHYKNIESNMKIIRNALEAKTKSGIEDDKHYLKLDAKISAYYHVMLTRSTKLGLMPGDDISGSGAWVGFNYQGKLEEDAVVVRYAQLLRAYLSSNKEDYAAILSDLEKTLGGSQYTASLLPGDNYAKVVLEDSYTRFEPLYKSQIIYLFVILLVIATWLLRNSESIYQGALYLLGVGFVIHTAGILVRMNISGRPPVIDLYSSAVFIGWTAVLMGFVVEIFWKKRNIVIVSALAGALTLLVAKGLEFEGAPGDTLKPLKAVLDTNFWLATHVTIVTLGYSAALLASILGMFYVIKSCVLNKYDKLGQKEAVSTIYGVVCFSLVCSFIGTVLGGIWADYSWGRFWGWDPKENGALMIVLWNAVILHSRWAGIAKTKGIAILSIVGGIIVSWSWFGTNMLGVGLHAYGFIGSAYGYLLGYWALCLLFVLTGWILKDKLKAEKN